MALFRSMEIRFVKPGEAGDPFRRFTPQTSIDRSE
jgi:hypothetical protein